MALILARRGEKLWEMKIMNVAAPKRSSLCDERFTDADQVALSSTETGWVYELTGSLAKYAVWQSGDGRGLS